MRVPPVRFSSNSFSSSAPQTVRIFCAACETQLYRYRKRGKGSLVKCFERRIVDDFTRGDLACPRCETPFARRAVIRGQPAHKIIGGKVFWR